MKLPWPRKPFEVDREQGKATIVVWAVSKGTAVDFMRERFGEGRDAVSVRRLDEDHAHEAAAQGLEVYEA